MQEDKELQEFKKKEYPKILLELFDIYQKLVTFEIYNPDFIKRKKEEWTK